MKKNIIAGMSILVASITLQSAAHAQGIPVAGGSVNFRPSVADMKNLQSQLDEFRKMSDLTGISHADSSASTRARDPEVSSINSSNALLVQILAVQQQTLSELVSINQHLAVSDAAEQKRGIAADDRQTATIASQNHTHVMH